MIVNVPMSRSIRRFPASRAVVLGVAAWLVPALSAAQDAKPPDGRKAAETEPARVRRTDAEWRSLLTYSQYMVTRLKATEPPFSGRYSRGHYNGTFHCVCCGATLFDARHKFESGTGWPSFWRPITVQALTESLDRSESEPRVEVTCSRCGAHIGHVFQDGPPPTGLRYCTNSLSLKLEPDSTGDASAVASRAPSKTSSRETARKAPARRAVHRRGGRY